MSAAPQVVQARSGDRVLNTMSQVGLVVTLLSPFIAAMLTWIEKNTSIVLGQNYQSQLETAVGLGIMYGVAKLHMRNIRKDPEVEAPAAPIVLGR